MPLLAEIIVRAMGDMTDEEKVKTKEEVAALTARLETPAA